MNTTENMKKLEELRRLGLEVYETTMGTMLEEMGASIGITNCCSVVVPQPK